MRTSRLAYFFAIVTSVVAAQHAKADFLVSSSNNNEILRYDMSGIFVGIFNQGDGDALRDPEGIAKGPDGNIYVSSGLTNQVLRYSGTTGMYLGVAASGKGLSGPLGLTFGSDNNLYVSSYFDNEILRFNPITGTYLGIAASGGGLSGPDGLAFGPDGKLYVASTAFNQSTGMTPDQVLQYDPTTGSFLSVFASGTGRQGFTGLAFGPDGNLYVSAINSNQVLRYGGPTGSSAGQFLGIFASGGGLAGPLGETFGLDGSLYVSGYSSNNVIHYASSGALIGTFISSGEGGLNGPSRSIFVDFASVPEPSSLILAGMGLASLVGFRRLGKVFPE